MKTPPKVLHLTVHHSWLTLHGGGVLGRLFSSMKCLTGIITASVVFGSASWCHAAAPAGADKAFSKRSSSTITLTPADWGFSDSDTPPDIFSAVKIATLPSTGILKVDGVNATAGQIVSILPSVPAGETWNTLAAAGSGIWRCITCSADGTKLAAARQGDIYVSNDSGASWTPRSTFEYWTSIASSADGSKLAAVAGINGLIYISSDYGVTWTYHEWYRNWQAITSSADGSKLAAVDLGGKIYTSTDSGENWTPRESNRNWKSIVSSSDGTKLAAVVYGGQIYTSNDSGVSWTARASDKSWYSITSSADGSKLAAVVIGGQIYTSIDSGISWTAHGSDKSWYSITSSAEGSKLAAVESSGYIHTSTDSGMSWTIRDYNSFWRGITSSADGSRLFAVADYDGLILSSAGAVPAITYTTPAGTGSASFTFQVQDSSATNNLDLSANTLSFDYVTPPPPKPPEGEDKSFSMLATTTVTLAETDWGFSDSDNPADRFSAVKINTLPTVGTLKVDGLNATAGQSFSIQPSGTPGEIWTAQSASGSRNWGQISSSADGIQLIAIGENQIYISTDSGVTWTPREIPRNWRSVTSSSDGSKLAAAVYDGQIYTSTNSGVSWVPRDSNRKWNSITSSADGSKLAAVDQIGYIYTSVDSGVSWTPRLSASQASSQWGSITSSADGAKLAAATEYGPIYTSSDSGQTWTVRTTKRNWSAISSSADGNMLAAVVRGGQIYTSNDSGLSWVARESARLWTSIASSADGSRLASVVDGGQIYISTDAGLNWTAREADRYWSSITCSADGNKFVAGGLYEHISTSAIAAPTITYTAPAGMGSASFTFQVQDSAATDNLDLSSNTLSFNYSTAYPTVTLPATPSGGWPINPLTGLYDIDVPVQNTTANVINGFRIIVGLTAYSSSHPSLVLSNASNIAFSYIDHTCPLAVGESVTQRLSFGLTSSGLPNPFNPMLVALTWTPPAMGGALPSGLSFSNAGIQSNNGGPFQLSWPSTVGRWYRIYYTQNLSTWFSASTPIQATTTQTQWSDTGPPHTSATPGTARFYKVSEIASP